MSTAKNAAVERFLAKGGSVTRVPPGARGRKQGWHRYTNRLRYDLPERRKRWEEANPYEAARWKRTPVWANMRKIRNFYRNTPPGCHVDHVVPLRGRLVSGLHVLSNLQYLDAKENHHFIPKIETF